MKNQQNESNALTIFGQNRAMKFKALERNEARALYEKENESISLTSEPWHFEDAALKKEFNQNPKIVKDLVEKLKGAKDSEVDAILEHLHKYQRKGVILHGFQKRDFLTDAVSGEMKEKDYVRLLDPYNGKTFTMGQAVATGYFVDLESALEEKGGTACGIAFDITYLGREKNATNNYESDRFDIKISEIQPLQSQS